jgi:hypothetical protein
MLRMEARFSTSAGASCNLSFTSWFCKHEGVAAHLAILSGFGAHRWLEKKNSCMHALCGVRSRHAWLCVRAAMINSGDVELPFTSSACVWSTTSATPHLSRALLDRTVRRLHFAYSYAFLTTLVSIDPTIHARSLCWRLHAGHIKNKWEHLWSAICSVTQCWPKGVDELKIDSVVGGYI